MGETMQSFGFVVLVSDGISLRLMSAHNFVGPVKKLHSLMRTIPQESAPSQRKGKATVPCDAKQGRKAKDRWEGPLTELYDRPLTIPAPKFSLLDPQTRNLRLIWTCPVLPN
jgi:hypothetical protein